MLWITKIIKSYFIYTGGWDAATEAQIREFMSMSWIIGCDEQETEISLLWSGFEHAPQGFNRPP
jgi:hypothetical protein